MTAPIIRRLENFTRLSSADREALTCLSSRRLRQLEAREDIIREGERPVVVNLVQEGWACRYRHLEDGRRQIMSFLLPGDFCDLNVFVLRAMDHSMGAVTPIAVAQVTREELDQIALDHSRVAEAMAWEDLVNAAVQREWTVTIGRRDAVERVAHLLCELFLRLQAIDLTEENGCELPLRQMDLADATGLSNVHVNRTLQELRRQHLIALEGRWLTVLDLEGLMSAALFDPGYLHLDHEGRHLDAND